MTGSGSFQKKGQTLVNAGDDDEQCQVDAMYVSMYAIHCIILQMSTSIYHLVCQGARSEGMNTLCWRDDFRPIITTYT